jgi:hypothetical protein
MRHGEGRLAMGWLKFTPHPGQEKDLLYLPKGSEAPAGWRWFATVRADAGRIQQGYWEGPEGAQRWVRTDEPEQLHDEVEMFVREEAKP